jgi:hypothetical protein
MQVHLIFVSCLRNLTQSCLRAPVMRSVANTRMYWTISARLEAFSRTLPPFSPPTSRLLYELTSFSIVCIRCSFLTLSTDRIRFNWSSVRLPARTAPSQGICKLVRSGHLYQLDRKTYWARSDVALNAGQVCWRAERHLGND